MGVCASLDLAAKVVLGFADAEVNALLGVDSDREATLALCAVGRTDQAPPPLREVPRIDHATQPLSSAEVIFADIPRMHAASELRNGTEAAAWRANPLRRWPVVEAGLISLAPHESTQMTMEQVILARRSTRSL